MKQWEIEAVRHTGDWRLVYLVAPHGDLRKTHEALIRDDPVWARARIRKSQDRDIAAEFWKRLKTESVRVRPD